MVRVRSLARPLALVAALAVVVVLGLAWVGAGHLERWRKTTTFTVNDPDSLASPRGARDLLAAERAFDAILIASFLSAALALAALLAGRRGLAAGRATGASRDVENSSAPPITTRPTEGVVGDTMLESRELFAQSHDLVFVLDARERFGAVNPRWLEAMGYSREEAMALRFSEVLRPDQIPLWQQIFAAARLGERSPSFETVLLSKEGREILVEGFCWPRLDPEGRFVELRGLLLDVSDRQRAEREQALGEERFRNLFERIPSALLIYDRRSFAILGANERALEQYGYARSEILAKRWTDLLAPEEQARADKLREEASVALAGAWQHRRSDGGIFEVEVSAYPTEFAGREAWLAFVRDTSEEKKTRAALRDSEERYRALFENSLALICIHDLEGRILAVNPAAANRIGAPAERLVGRSIEKLLLPAFRDRFALYLERIRQEGSSRGTMHVQSAEGDDLVWAYQCIRFDRPGAPSYVLGHAFDVTDRRRLESERQVYLERIERQKVDLELRNREVERANRHKSEFLATMSHELRTPLTAIIGFSDLLADGFAGDLNETQANYLGFVRKGSRHLLQLINDVLDMSKIEAGRLDLDPEDLEVEEVVAEVCSTIEPLSAAKRLEVTYQFPDRLIVHADRVRLKQIFFNLLSNAVKFSADAGRVSVVGSRVGRFVCLSVRDEGSGVAPENQEAIFQPFRQVPTSGRREGTGLGLAIVRRLVEQHGGRIWVESAPGKGSTFAFLVPAAKLAEVRPAPAPALRVEERTRPMILVVEDDAAWRELLQSQLAAEGYDVVAMPWEPAAAAKIRALSPDLVLLEVLSGQSAGWRLLETLGKDGGEDSPAVVVVSDLDERRRGFALGAVDFLVKPPVREILLEVVARHAPPSVAAKPAPVLLVDHRPERQRILAAAVHDAGLRPLTARDGPEALEILAWVHPCALVISLDLPEMDGYQTVLRLRADPASAELPILALIAEGTSMEGLRVLSGRSRLLEVAPVPDPQRITEALRGLLAAPVPAG
jgi:PAS domain S-box-containing protein